jgi:predicted HicB family RNase H-like nuclease
MKENVSRYIYRVEWSPEDGEHVGLCTEFPSLSWLAPTPARAFSGIRRLVSTVVRDMEKTGEPIPEPLVNRACSGKIALRTTPALHRALTIRAAEAKMSLNRYLNSRLAAALSSPHADEEPPTPQPRKAPHPRDGKSPADKGGKRDTAVSRK